MIRYKKSTKEWEILKLFIIHEGFALESVKSNPRRKQKGVVPRDLAPDHFYSYPDDIVARLTTQQYADPEEKGSYLSKPLDGYVKDIHGVTIPTAGKVCRKFVELGIFMRIAKKRTEKKFQETTQYYLKSDFETFKIVLFFLMQNCDPYERVEMLSHPYFRNIITEDLVRTRLFEKQVSIISRIDIFDWAPNEIPKVLSIFDEKKKRNNGDFEKRILEEIQQKETDPLFGNEDASDWIFSVPLLGQYHIPIFPEGIPAVEKLEILKNGHPSYDSDSKNFNEAFTRFPDVFNNQFETIEREELILPVLGLIQSSPMALQEFILGNWEPFRLPHGLFHKKNENFNNPLFMRLISLAISDMSGTLKIPGNNNVDSFVFREFSNQLTIDEEYCQEQGILRIGMTCGYDIYYDMGYATRDRKYPPSSPFPVIEEKTPPPNKFWVKIRMRQVSPLFIRNSQVKDITSLLKLLKGQSLVSNHIREKLSNRMQNLILRYKNKVPTPAFITFLVEEINRGLLRENFYVPKAFSEVKISQKTRDAIDGYTRFLEYGDDSTGLKYSLLLYRNRLLFEDAFYDAIVRISGDMGN